MGITRILLAAEQIPNLVSVAVDNHQNELLEGMWEEDRRWPITTT